RDAACPLYRRSLQHNHAGAADGELHQMLEMPIRRAAVVGRILAHGRHSDAVGELDGPHGEGREEVWHSMTLMMGTIEKRASPALAARCYRTRPAPSTAALLAQSRITYAGLGLTVGRICSFGSPASCCC